MRPETEATDQLTDIKAAHRGGRARLLRWAVNCWLVFHLCAIIIAPASVAPSSEVIESAWSVFQPYLEFMYLNHGHHFFAPEPAASTLISFAPNAPTARPSPVTSPTAKPCLACLYHRHFMLTEHLHDAQLREMPDELLDEWVNSYAAHIRHEVWCCAGAVDRARSLASFPRRCACRQKVERSGKL